MKTLYIECNMGAAGDMLMAALAELLPEPDRFVERINNIGIPDVSVHRQAAVKCGVMGTHMAVLANGREEISHDVAMGAEHSHEHGHHHGHDHKHEHGHHHDHEHHHHENAHNHHHIGLAEITTLIEGLAVSEQVKKDAVGVYRLLAEAEAAVHGKTLDSVHFHEVGMLDAVADIVGVCMLIEETAPERIIASPIHVGSGQVRCAHGILPVPAPATAHLLKGMPSYGGDIKGELCTPTGAALLKYFAAEFGSRPVMVIDKIGYGMGEKDFAAANCVRVFLGETDR